MQFNVIPSTDFGLSPKYSRPTSPYFVNFSILLCKVVHLLKNILPQTQVIISVISVYFSFAFYKINNSPTVFRKHWLQKGLATELKIASAGHSVPNKQEFDYKPQSSTKILFIFCRVLESNENIIYFIDKKRSYLRLYGTQEDNFRLIWKKIKISIESI